MDQKKIAEFIYTLRKEKDLTQQELADTLYIGREAVSKWERGINIPDTSTLVSLSELFDVSINEILLGERRTKENEKELENMALYVMDFKDKKILGYKYKLLFVIVVSILLVLGIRYVYYIEIYKLFGNSDDIYVDNGLLVKTHFDNKIYIGNIDKAKNIKLYSKNKLLYNVENSNFLYSSVYKVDEKNLELEINSKRIKLESVLDYKNSILFRKYKSIDSQYGYENSKYYYKGEKYTIIAKGDTIINIYNKNYEHVTYNINERVIQIYTLTNYIFYDYDYHKCLIGNCDEYKDIIDEFKKCYLDKGP